MQSGITFEYVVVAIVSILIGLVIHEFMHGFVGYLLGDTTAKDQGRLSLNPFRHIDPYMTILLPIITIIAFGSPLLAARPVPFNPERVKYGEFGAALIAIAGPLTNLLLAIIAALIYNAVGIFHSGTQYVLGIFIVINVAIFVFNLLPIPPLDGSRVLFAFAPEAIQDFMRSIEPYGLFIVFGIVIVSGGFLLNINQFILNHLP